MGSRPVDASREALLDGQRASQEFKHSFLADELKSSKPYVNIYKRRCPDTPSAAGLGCPDLNSLGFSPRESPQRGGTARGQWRGEANCQGHQSQGHALHRRAIPKLQCLEVVQRCHARSRGVLHGNAGNPKMVGPDEANTLRSSSEAAGPGKRCGLMSDSSNRFSQWGACSTRR